MPPIGDPGQHFAIDCDLLAKINATINAIWINGNMRTGCCLMAPLNSCGVGSSTEDLQTSEGKTSKFMHIEQSENNYQCGSWPLGM